MIRFKLPENTHMGAWFMPHDIIDNIWDFWTENKHTADQGCTPEGDVYGGIKDSLDLGIRADEFLGPWGSYREHLQLCLDDYLIQYPAAGDVAKFNIYEGYNLQWYPKGGGFKSWHHENDGNKIRIHRHLVFMTYCNDVPDAGTHFKHQDIVIPSCKGLTVIWPAGFTHNHKGQITNEHEKMIVTGWYNFKDMFNEFGVI